ncbi:MAG: type II toxin-antitoxin system RelE/ParE family toxin [Proteobacteria bacterium]|nr:type II toxin-antitoxin system RelE/ParE family toxin [Pseudomonadota bacterium]
MTEYPYKINFDRVKKYLYKLKEKQRAKILQLVERLKEQGENLPNYNSNWAKVIKGSRHQPQLLELRATIGPSIIRIAFYVDTEAKIAYLLWGGDKKGVSDKLFYRRLIREADDAIDSIKEGNLTQDKEK